MADAVGGFVAQGFTHVAFGDLFLEDVRQYRESRLAGTGLTPIFPLWKRAPTTDLARDDDRRRPGSATDMCGSAGARSDHSPAAASTSSSCADLPPTVDPCGERGEFHSFAYAGPMFAEPIAIRVGDRVERDGFVFCDLEDAPTDPRIPDAGSRMPDPDP